MLLADTVFGEDLASFSKTKLSHILHPLQKLCYVVRRHQVQKGPACLESFILYQYFFWDMLYVMICPSTWKLLICFSWDGTFLHFQDSLCFFVVNKILVYLIFQIFTFYLYSLFRVSHNFWNVDCKLPDFMNRVANTLELCNLFPVCQNSLGSSI